MSNVTTKDSIMDSVYKKSILSMSDSEILLEIASILGKPVKKIEKNLGWITDNPSTYFHNNIVDKASLYQLYKNGPHVDDYITTLAITSRHNRPSDLFSLIKEQKPGNEVLDYGCGVSTHGIACAQLGCSVHIVDISDKMLDVAQQRYKNRGLTCMVHPIDVDFPNLQRKTLDTIICADVVEHVPDPITLLKHFIGWLKLGGVVHLHVSSYVNLSKGHLPDSIKKWNTLGIDILKRRFKKLSKHNYQLIN